METIDIPFHLLRFWVAGYFIYWGLNGFFGWAKIPANSAKFESFIGRLMAVPVLMTVVKVLEILAGLMIGSGYNVQSGLLILLPIVIVIVGSHLLLNFAKGWRVALIVLLPFTALAVLSITK